PWMDVSSRSGLATAFWAASSARCSPRPVPVPIIAMPIPDMIVRTSAKSRFTSPGTRIRSEMPWTACWSTASATRKASISGVPRPTSGFEPAPRPCVSFAPSWSFTGAGEAWRACTSVLATMNSTPVNSAAIIRLTALLPPPPRPMTLIFAACGTSSSSKSGRRVRSLSIRSSFRCLPAAALRRRPGERVPSDGNSGGCSPRPVLKDVIQKTGQAPREPSEQAPVRPRGRRGLSPPAGAVEGEAYCGRVDRALHDVGKAAYAERHAAPDRLIEDRLGQLGDAFHERRAAGHDGPGRRRVLEPRPAELAGDEREDLLDPRLDDLREDLARELARLPA